MEARFWEKVIKSNDGCWQWQAGKFENGYGLFKVGVGKLKRAHRVSWEMHFGAIPREMIVLHHCDNPLCVRPDHLSLGTSLSNSRDMFRKGRQKIAHGEAHGSRTRPERFHGQRSSSDRNKLTASSVRAIRHRYAMNTVSLQQLAKEHGVSVSSIHAVVSRKTYRYIE